MQRAPAEVAATDRFDEAYARLAHPVMLGISHKVFCCAYPGISWTTQAEADGMIPRLGLGPGVRLLDLGSGAGWPALYLVSATGCHATLVDLPETGLEMSRARAAADGIAAKVKAVGADAAALPFADGSFDAINHSDLLCCLVPKRAVLEECRRVLAPGGRMAFTVIYVPDEITGAERDAVLASGPEFTETDQPYPDLLAETGWHILARQDVTAGFADAVDRQARAERAAGDRLAALIGADEVAERQANYAAKRANALAGKLRRVVYEVVAR